MGIGCLGQPFLVSKLPHRRLRTIEQTSHWQEGPNNSRFRGFLFTFSVLFLLPSILSFFFILCFLPVYLFHAIGTCEYMWIYDKPPAVPFSVPLLLRIDVSLNQLKLSHVQLKSGKILRLLGTVLGIAVVLMSCL